MWLVGVVSRRPVWLVGVGGIYGCDYIVVVVLRRYIDFLILLIPTPLVSVLFCSSILFFLNVFRTCSSTFCNCERSELSSLFNGTDFSI